MPQALRQFLDKPMGRAIAIGATSLVVILVVLAGYIWFSGGNGQANGTLTTATLPPDPNSTTFVIEQAGSTASFSTTEVLLGQNSTVVGTTNQVSGEIQVDLKNPARSRVGTIRVDVNTLATDNEFRNRTLRSRILESTEPQNQFAEFAPTSLSGMPTAASVGQTITFQINGNLTIHSVTRPATFNTQVTITSQTQITGTASTTVNYHDFNINIPDVPSVSDVGQNIQLQLKFTAQAQS